MAPRKKKEPLLNYRFRCRQCALYFRVRMREDDPDPECPNLQCGAVQTPIGFDPSQGKAPGIGGNLLVKAMDTTANIVMADYGMTDLHSARPGEAMTPKLPPDQQRRADAMFDSRKRAELMGGGNPMAGVINSIAHSGVQGAQISPSGGVDAMTALHKARFKPKVHLLD